MINTYVKSGGSHNQTNLQIHRGSTAIGGPRQISVGDGYGYTTPHVLNWKDSPSTTSSITYSLQACDANDTGTIYVNRSGHASSTETTGTSSIILMEISG